jgi:outer membrane protein assembly factor BamB
MLDTPLRPEPVTIARIDLGEVHPGSVTSGGNPETSLAFDVTSTYLTVGTFDGHLRVLKAEDGEEVVRKRLPGAVVKRVAVMEFGGRVYAGEMSYDAFVRGYFLPTGDEMWRYRLADDLGTSRPAREDDFFALYSYPRAQCMMPVGNDVLVAGMHSWDDSGVRRHRSRVYRFAGKTGDVLWKFPDNAPLERNIMWFDTDGDVVALMAQQWEVPGPGDATPQNAVYLLDAHTGRLLAQHTFKPLAPHFKTAPMWYGLALDESGALVVGLMDGRGAVFHTRDAEGKRGLKLVKAFDLATPIEVTGVPIYAGVGWAAASDGMLYLMTDGRLIVSEGMAGGKSVRADHPGANTIFAVSPDTGTRRWQYKLTTTAQSLASGRGVLVASTQQTYSADDTLDYGLTVLDTRGGNTPAGRLIYRYATAGPIVAVAVSPDGRRIAAVECAVKLPDDINVIGAYRLHLLH